MLLDSLLVRIVPVSATLAGQAQALLDQKTKPRRSLGQLELLACQYCAARGSLSAAAPKKAIVVMAGDHGVADEGVSAYPKEVTAQMVLNFAAGGAAINALAKQAGAELLVVDMGVSSDVSAAGVRKVRIGPGTANFTRTVAMPRTDALRAIQVGVSLADELAQAGVTLIGMGEMGIANTTAASALVAAFTGHSAAQVTGRGTGVDDDGFSRKVAAVDAALRLHRPNIEDPVGVLAALGGYEIAGLVGLVLGAAAQRIPVVVDGFITLAAALTAVRIAPDALGYLIASHRSVEPGFSIGAAALDLHPLFDLQMRLGEGSGAALAMGLVDGALSVLREMATFGEAQVSDAGV